MKNCLLGGIDSVCGVDKAAERAKRKEAKKQNKIKKDAKCNETSKEPEKKILAENERNKAADQKEKEASKSEKTQRRATQEVHKAKTSGPATGNKPENVEPNKTGNVEPIKPGNVEPIKPENVEPNKPDPKNVETTESKAELRAKRRAVQEAQRQAKASGAVNNEPIKTKDPNPKNVETTESKAELRAKRRAIQEAQRLAKLQAQAQENQKSPEKATKEPLKIKRIAVRKESISVVTGGNFQKQVQLFNHLYFHHSTSITKDSATVTGLHSSIIRLGVRYMSHNILGSNARCLALLSAIKNVVVDYRTPISQEFCRSLESNIQASTNYLQKCRPLAVSMINAIRHIKLHLTQISTSLSDDEKKTVLLDVIDTYIRDEIGMADEAISITVQAKISKGDVILTYGCSSIVRKILLDAHENGKEFSVIVVDARPLLEGREMLRKLINAGVNCSYLMINAVSFIMGRVTKVLLGAHSLLANGYVMSRAGTAQVALIAQAFNKPVLVCCETYKFCERVQTDSIVHNEIGDPDKLVLPSISGVKSPLANWKDNRYVTPLNLMYDVTPPHLVTAVVTELAILPCTSVPVILRIKPNEIAS